MKEKGFLFARSLLGVKNSSRYCDAKIVKSMHDEHLFAEEVWRADRSERIHAATKGDRKGKRLQNEHRRTSGTTRTSPI
ncbi:conserved protein of unknown function [Candidatus Methylacidiphilum fumarolicum]|uniref:Transposase n=1 Tax=Candidatus Methylacidiphilum fumarolicum TaxID=591154 RepID=A0ABN8XDQ3_9BACT|nr:conserved protein of unknown function [Candidatus Methylacidiphilum fumarolicum]